MGQHCFIFYTTMCFEQCDDHQVVTINTMTHLTIATQWLDKHVPEVTLSTVEERPSLSNGSLDIQYHRNCWRWCPCRSYKGGKRKNAFIHKWAIIRHSSFVRKFGSVVQLSVQLWSVNQADNRSWRISIIRNSFVNQEWLVNQNQISHSGREDTRSPVRNGASVR
jgi:hypothetical protein